MKARLTAVFCLILVLTLSLLSGIQSTASQPPAAPPPGELASGGEVPVTIIPSSLLGSESLQEDKVVSIVTEELGLSSAATPYLKAKVRVLYGEAGEADSLIVYLPHKDTYLFETAKIELGENYSVVSVEKDYVEQEGDFSQEGATYATCPDDTVQIVVSSCCTEFPSSVAAVNNSYNAAVAAGYETVKLLGSQENTTAIKNWLSCPNLIYWGRVGHGNSSGILLDDASLTTSNYWNGMAGELPGKILYFNSCQVFNNPLKTSIFNTGVAKFIGGICSLWVGTSEPVWQCWNEHDFVQDPPPGGEEDEMCYWSQQCESDMNYPDPGCHGCGGPGPHVFPTPGAPPPTPTPTPPPGTMHVDDIQMSYVQLNKTRYEVSADITIKDQDAGPVNGATVSAQWTLPKGRQVNQQQVTGATGVASFSIRSKAGTYQICVTDVTKAGWIYNPSQNVKTCETLTVP